MFDFGIKDIIDVFLVALMLYYLYRLMKESRSLNVFIGIIVFVLVWLFVSQMLEMRLLGVIMDKLVKVGVTGLIIRFLRRDTTLCEILLARIRGSSPLCVSSSWATSRSRL